MLVLTACAALVGALDGAQAAAHCHPWAVAAWPQGGEEAGAGAEKRGGGAAEVRAACGIEVALWCLAGGRWGRARAGQYAAAAAETLCSSVQECPVRAPTVLPCWPSCSPRPAPLHSPLPCRATRRQEREYNSEAKALRQVTVLLDPRLMTSRIGRAIGGAGGLARGREGTRGWPPPCRAWKGLCACSPRGSCSQLSPSCDPGQPLGSMQRNWKRRGQRTGAGEDGIM